MELEQIKEVLDSYLREDITNRSAVILLSDKEKALCYGGGKRGDLVRLFYQMLIQDTNEEFVSCLDEAIHAYMVEKKRRVDNEVLRLPMMPNKMKS